MWDNLTCEITIDNCYKCDLVAIIGPNNSQYFWINRRDLEIEISVKTYLVKNIGEN